MFFFFFIKTTGLCLNLGKRITIIFFGLKALKEKNTSRSSMSVQPMNLLHAQENPEDLLQIDYL